MNKLDPGPSKILGLTVENCAIYKGLFSERCLVRTQFYSGISPLQWAVISQIFVENMSSSSRFRLVTTRFLNMKANTQNFLKKQNECRRLNFSHHFKNLKHKNNRDIMVSCTFLDDSFPTRVIISMLPFEYLISPNMRTKGCWTRTLRNLLVNISCSVLFTFIPSVLRKWTHLKQNHVGETLLLRQDISALDILVLS